MDESVFLLLLNGCGGLMGRVLGARGEKWRCDSGE